jgi:hypothetical protein
MPKKQKRRVSGTTAAEAPASLAAERPPVGSPVRASYTQEFNPDYTHVTHDLKQIGIMAGSFLVVLVVLSFFLR